MTQPTIDQITAKAIAVRDKIAEIKKKHAEELKPYEDGMELLSNLALKFLDETHQSNAKTADGTAYIAEPESIKVTDRDAFLQWTIENEALDLLTSAVSKEAYRGYVDEGLIIPGVETTKIRVARFRRS